MGGEYLLEGRATDLEGRALVLEERVINDVEGLYTGAAAEGCVLRVGLLFVRAFFAGF